MLGAMLALFAALIAPTEVNVKGSLYGMVVVIDPGHGGSDPGAHGTFSGGTVYENEYCYDVAVRLHHMVKRRGGIAVMTIRDPDRGFLPYNGSAYTPLPLDRDEVYSNGRVVRAGSKGLAERVAVGNRMLAKYPKHRVVFVSIHFDANNNRELEGVHLIVPARDSVPALARALEVEFRSAGRLRKKDGQERNPVVKSGDQAHGLRRLYILGSSNQVYQRVLVELGNFASERDVWRLRDHNVRQNYADIMVRALERVNVPGVKFREVLKIKTKRKP